MERKLEGRVVLITGTGGGQGRAAAVLFAAHGAHVYGCDIGKNHLETEQQVKAAGGNFHGVDEVDLGDPEAARNWVERVVCDTGTIDIVYNNASAARFVPFSEISVDDWHFSIRNELDLVFYVTRFAWPYLRRPGSLILNVASVSGIKGSTSGAAAHAAAKGAVIALTRQLAAEGASDGIRVIAISPGVVQTPGTAGLLGDPEFRGRMLEGNMIKRLGTPEEVAALALFLASDDAGYITGTNVVIDGGKTSW